MSPSSSSLDVDPIAGLIAKEALTKVPDEYVDFANVLSPDLTFKLSECIEINDHAIELVNGQQRLYGPIYSLWLVDPEGLHSITSQSRTSLLLGQVVPDQGLKSRITAPLTSMLKTLSTKSAEPRKGIVGVGGGGRNRAEPVGKYESDGVIVVVIAMVIST